MSYVQGPAIWAGILVATVAVVILVSIVRPCFADYAPDRIIVELRPHKAARLKSLNASIGATTRRSLGQLGFYSIKLPKGMDVKTAIAAYIKDPDVSYAGPDHIIHIATNQVFPNDPIFYSGDDIFGLPQWGLYNDGYNNGQGGTFRADIHAPEAWAITTGSPNVVIAMVDTGVDFSHPDLQGKIWTNPGEIPGNGIDDDHNGYVDDVHGWNFVSNNNNPADDNDIYHGTFTAGIAAADTGNNVGIAGVAWNCMIMPLKVIAANGQGLESDAALAVTYAVGKGVRVINLSLEGDDVPALHAAIDYAWAHGAICVCASGNEDVSTPTFPASYSHSLAVGATNENDQRCTAADWFSGGSNYGSYLDVVAPGNWIVSLSGNADYQTAPGTSASAPFVSGTAALIWSLHPDWTNVQVFNQILHTSDHNPPNAWDPQTGWGRINAYRALTETLPEVTTVADAKAQTLGAFVTLRGQVLTTASGEIPGWLYVEDPNRSGGMLVTFAGSGPSGLNEGDIVDVSGTLGTVGGELALTNASAAKTGSGTVPGALFMTNRALGGGTLGNQQGVVDHYSLPRQMAAGTNNIGLLVKTAGRVTAVGYDWFYIDDGANLDDGTANTGIYVFCGSLQRPSLNQYAVVTGISGCDQPSGSTVLRRVLRPRNQGDIVVP